MAAFTAISHRWITAIVILSAMSVFGAPAVAQGADTPAPLTIGDPTVPIDELEWKLRPLTKDELVVEADGWLSLVKAKVEQISACEIDVRRANRLIGGVGSATPPSDAAVEQATQTKQQRLEDVVQLREQRTALISRLNAVLDALELKGGDPAPYRTYLTAVAGVTADVDVSDMSGLWATIRGWATSKEGGVRWGWNVCYFVLTIVVFWILSRIAGKATQRAMAMAKNTTDLMRHFVTSVVRRTVLFAGLLAAITFLEVKVGPLLAIVGAVGFVVAFALQGTLSNFASGLMILAYRPFDVGDVVSVGGATGVVQSMNLVSTQINTFDNQRVVVPNNSIWGSVITNITGLPTRRVDMTFGVSYGDDADRAVRILEELVRKHELVLDDPAPVVKVHELGDSSVNLICRPWTETANYWTVYWDITRQAKQRFDAEGVTIPFPQRDVHVYHENSSAAREPHATLA